MKLASNRVGAGADGLDRGGGASRPVATVTVCSGATVAIGHIGDSRAHLVRSGCVELLTTDHAARAGGDSGVGDLDPSAACVSPGRAASRRDEEATAAVVAFVEGGGRW
jgi:hypothetical protein